MTAPWYCAQLGAREHYAIPRALHRTGRLGYFFTDAWAPPGGLLSRLFPALRDRFHPDLAQFPVTSISARLLAFEAKNRLRKGKAKWPIVIRRDRWFQSRLIRALDSLPATEEPPILFSYSYTALHAFRFAKKRGWRTVLGQMDPGPVEERLVADLHKRHPGVGSYWTPATDEYWQNWREECALADCILVNSSWPQSALITEGVPKEKLRILPLAFEVPAASVNFQRTYPAAFTEQRPLRVLFLGQVNLRKGIAEVMDAVRLLKDSPIEFWIVGEVQMDIPPDLRNHPRVRWAGIAPRGTVSDYYRQADVFLFPTHSDGFGLTQLEAQAWKLPIIASTFCAQVVEHGRNGWLLPEVSAPAIAARLLECLRHPEILQPAADSSEVAPEYSLSAVSASLAGLFSD